MIKDLVSIIVPVHNVQDYLVECIDSLLVQSYPMTEIILINDGSSDKSEEICISYAKRDSRIHFYTQLNKGVSAARNRGLENAKGEYISFVDADDFVQVNYIEEMVAIIKNRGVDCVQCGYKKLKGNTFDYILRGNEFEIQKNQIIDGLLSGNGYGRTWCMLYTRKVIGDNRFNEDLSMGEDAEFNLRVYGSAASLFYIDKPLYIYRVNPTSTVKKYDDYYAERYKKTAVCILNNLSGNQIRQRKAQPYICYMIVQTIVNYACNINHKEKFASRLDKVKRVCNDNLYKYALQTAVIDFRPISFWLLIKLLNLKQYWLVVFLCLIKQR